MIAYRIAPWLLVLTLGLAGAAEARDSTDKDASGGKSAVADKDGSKLRGGTEFAPDAMQELGQVFDKGIVEPDIDPTEAYDAYERAAEAGDGYGRDRMCVAYLLGQGRKVDLNKGFGYCAKLPANHPTRLFSDGFDYANGLRGPKDENGAAALYMQAAERGSGEAMDALGQMATQKGKVEAARKWYRQAAVHGAINGVLHYAAMVEAGQGGPADAVEARWLYGSAARSGHAEAKGWLAAQGEAPDLPRVDVKVDNVMETLPGASGSKTKPLTINIKTLTWQYPTEAINKEVEASVGIHCYIDASHHIDVCLIQNEEPTGYGFGATIAALFNGNLSVPAQDPNGVPTANSDVAFTFRFKM